MFTPAASSSVGSTARPHASGTRNPASGSRSLTGPRAGSGTSVRTVYTAVDGKLVPVTLAVHRPFHNGLVLIACESKKHIVCGNVLVRSRQLAEKYKVAEFYIVFSGLFDAHRAFDTHARDGYEAEADLLEALTLEKLPAAMRRTWELAGASGAQTRAWTRQVNALGAKLKYARGEEKSKARKKILRAADLDDATGRHNPSAARMRLMAALSAARDRRQKVPLLDAHCACIAAQLECINMAAVAMVSNLEIEVDRVMLRVKEAAEGKAINLEALAVCMNNEAAHFASRNVDPYGNHLFRHLAKDADIVADALRHGRLTTAMKRLDVMKRSMLLLNERKTVETALTFVSRLKHTKKDLTAAYRKIVADVIQEVRDFLSTNQNIDAGFRHKVAGNMRNELARAQTAIEAKDITLAYDALYSASRCF